MLTLDSTPSDTSPGYAIPPPGYRLPAGTRLGRVRLQVSSLARSLAFYKDLLGFHVLRQTDAAVALGAEDGGEILIELQEHPGAVPVPRQGRLGLYHFAVLLPDRRSLARFALHLAENGISAGASDHAVSEAFYLTDPDGLGIEIYADRPRNQWPVRNGKLAMTTAPIDSAGLLREARDGAWTGMPAGTSIGHVHLHVGDLEMASAFFHHALGFDEVLRMPGALFLSAGGYHHHLGANTWAAGAAPPREDDARLLEWTLVLPREEDTEAAARSLQKAGYDIVQTEDGRLIHDPWGTALRLIPPPDPPQAGN